MAKIKQEISNADELEMAKGTRGFAISSTFVLKGCEALLAFMKSEKYLTQMNTSGKFNLLAPENYSFPIFVNFSLWVIPKRGYRGVKITNLPHGIHGGISKRVCLIVPNKEGKTSEETVRFFKALAKSLSKVHDFDAITWKDLKPRLDSFDDKRNLAKSYDLFLADASLKDFLMPKFGKVFKRCQKFPLSVSLQRAAELKSVLSGTHFFLHNEGNNYSYLIGHSGMTSKVLRDNVIESLSQLAKMVPNGWRNVRSAGMVGKSSAFIPIYDSSDVSNLAELSSIYKQAIVKSVPLETKNSDEAIHREQEKVVNEVLKIRKGNKHLANFSKLSQLKKKVLQSVQNRKMKMDSNDVSTRSNKENVFDGGVKKRKEKAKKRNVAKEYTKVHEKVVDVEVVCDATIESSEVQENHMAALVKSKELRSISDTALLKTEKRKLKRLALEMSEEQLTTREINMLTEPKTKKRKPALLSPKLTGYDKHLFEDSVFNEKTTKRSKPRDQQMFTGLEQYILSGNSKGSTNSEKVDKSSDHTVEIPEYFFATEEGGTPFENAAGIPASAKIKQTVLRRSVAATRRSLRVPAVAEITPLRRSARINSRKKMTVR